MRSPMALLCKLLEMKGYGQPLWGLKYNATSPNGYLYFTYTVQVPALSEPFTGTVMILPGPSAAATVEDARCAVAREVLTAIYRP